MLKQLKIKEMKIIYNNIIPFPGYGAINIFGILFVRKGIKVTDRTLRHEMIHTRQIWELLGVLFYVLYFLEWLVRLIIHRNQTKAYRSISFEKEAYSNENDVDYLKNRKLFAFIKYI